MLIREYESGQLNLNDILKLIPESTSLVRAKLEQLKSLRGQNVVHVLGYCLKKSTFKNDYLDFNIPRPITEVICMGIHHFFRDNLGVGIYFDDLRKVSWLEVFRDIFNIL